MGEIVSGPKKKPTVGIIGPDPSAVAEFGRVFVQVGNERGCRDDQDFFETLAVGATPRFTTATAVLSTDGFSVAETRLVFQDIESAAWLCSDAGCDVIVYTGLLESDAVVRLRREIDDGIVVVSLCDLSDNNSEDNLTALARVAYERCDSLTKNQCRSGAKYCSAHHVSIEEQQQVFLNVQNNLDEVIARINSRLGPNGSYAILRDGFVGVLGGAGPMTSADLCWKLTRAGCSFVHFSVSSAPARQRFELREPGAPTYVCHYKAAVALFNRIGTPFLTIPCNTAHMRLSEYITEFNGEFINLITTFMDFSKSIAEPIVLLGTSRSIGVGLIGNDGNPSEEDGIYDQIRVRDYPNLSPFIKPTPDQLKRVLEGIVAVKIGETDSAREIISEVLRDIKTEHNFNRMTVGLVCTELPLPFETASSSHMYEQGVTLIDPVALIVERCKDKINGFSNGVH